MFTRSRVRISAMLNRFPPYSGMRESTSIHLGTQVEQPLCQV